MATDHPNNDDAKTPPNSSEQSTNSQERQSLKDKVLRGSFYLTIRQVLASGFSLISTLFIARLLGPERYGLVSASMGVFYFLRWTCRLGLGAYLIRKPDVTDTDLEQVLAFYNICGLLLCIGLWFTIPVYGWWIDRAEITPLMRFLLPALWLDLIGSVSISQLNRHLQFDRISLIEVVAQAANYMLAVCIVVFYNSYWGPIIGTVLQIAISTALSLWFYPIRLRLKLRASYLIPALSYGVSFHCSTWLFNLRELTIPIFVSRLAGIEAVGIANIAIRMVKQIILLRNVLKGMSMSVMAKLIDDASAIQRAISRGMAYQAFLIGLICAIFASLATWLVPAVFGQEWLLSARLAPLIGISTLVSSVFDLHSATLYAANRTKAVILSNFAYIVILWATSALLIGPLGVWGYGIAEILAIPAYWIVHRALKQMYGSPDYRLTFYLILASSVPALTGIWLPTWVSIIALTTSYAILFAFNSSARQLLQELKSLISSKSMTNAKTL